jgi:hypothetical protein
MGCQLTLSLKLTDTQTLTQPQWAVSSCQHSHSQTQWAVSSYSQTLALAHIHTVGSQITLTLTNTNTQWAVSSYSQTLALAHIHTVGCQLTLTQTQYTLTHNRSGMSAHKHTHN